MIHTFLIRLTFKQFWPFSLSFASNSADLPRNACVLPRAFSCCSFTAAFTEAASLETDSRETKTLIRSQEGQIENDSHRSLRVDPAKEVAEEEERFKVPIVDKITKYLIQKMLDYCLYRNKDPKQVWGILRLNGYKGRAHLKPRHKYYRTYLAMWKDKKAKEAAKNAANFA